MRASGRAKRAGAKRERAKRAGAKRERAGARRKRAKRAGSSGSSGAGRASEAFANPTHHPIISPPSVDAALAASLNGGLVYDPQRRGGKKVPWVNKKALRKAMGMKGGGCVVL